MLSTLAEIKSYDKDLIGPFTVESRNHGKDLIGGKPDDITVILAILKVYHPKEVNYYR
jgi:hypothetical protein